MRRVSNLVCMNVIRKRYSCATGVIPVRYCGGVGERESVCFRPRCESIAGVVTTTTELSATTACDSNSVPRSP